MEANLLKLCMYAMKSGVDIRFFYGLCSENELHQRLALKLPGGSRTLLGDRYEADGCIHADIGAFPLIWPRRVSAFASSPSGGRRGIDRKLADLGLTTGWEVTVVSRGGGGRMVVAREDMRLALGTGMAHRVLVARVEDDGR